MVRIEWFGNELQVNRLVLGSEVTGTLAKTFRQLAATHGLELADQRANPREGDLWVWGRPYAGWGGLRPGQFGLVLGPKVYLALARLRSASRPPTPLDQAMALVYEGAAV